MSITSEINRISGNVADALDAIEAKGVTVPSGSNSDDLATLIGQITGGGTGAISVVDTQDTAGGTIRTITALDISDTTAVASDVASGKYFYTANGTKTAGTASGGGSTLWFGAASPRLLHTATHNVTLSDTNFSSLTPSTTTQYLTLPATAYSSAGTNVIFDVYSLYDSNDYKLLKDYGVIVVYEMFADIKYNSGVEGYHITGSSNLVLFWVGQAISGMGTNSYVSQGAARGTNGSGIVNMQMPTGIYFAYPTFTAEYGGSPGSIYVRNVTCKTASTGIKVDTTYMPAGAFSYIDAENTVIKYRCQIYEVDNESVRNGETRRALYMAENVAFPTD